MRCQRTERERLTFGKVGAATALGGLCVECTTCISLAGHDYQSPGENWNHHIATGSANTTFYLDWV